MNMRLPWIAGALLLMLGAAGAQPKIYWASDPVQPNDTVLVCGDGFGEKPVVELAMVADGEARQPGVLPVLPAATLKPVDVLQPSDQSLKFVVPASYKPGTYVFRVIVGAAKSEPRYLNVATPYWAQGDIGTNASPGGWIRIFGRCMAAEGQKPQVAVCVSTGKIQRDPLKFVALPVKASDPWSVTAQVPASLAEGQYVIYVHSGSGRAAGWARVAAPIAIAKPEVWPRQVFNVRDFGATGEARAQDGGAIRAALAQAEAKGGGIVMFPRGLYQVTGTLQIPRNVILRGEGMQLVSLCWPDTEDPYTLIQGTNHFGLEDLTIHASNCVHVIAGEVGKPDSGHCFLRRVRVRADAYRGHLKTSEVDERFSKSMRLSTGGGDTVRLGGENIEITDCDLYGSGRSLYLLRARGARVTNNTFYNGRWGWYCLDGSDGLILEDNRIVAGDLMSTGGSLNTYSSACSQNVWYARNHLARCMGWDREAMTSDAGYGAYFGTAEAVAPEQLVLAEDAKWGGRDWTGGGVFILGGKGMGQYRQIAAYDGRKVTLDRPWDVLPDTASAITITMMQRQYLFVDNHFEDAGVALQYYGTSIDHVAAGNKSTRAGGFYNSGRWYRHFQPSWYCQFLGNEILEGANYRFGANNSIAAGLSFLGTHGLQAQGGQVPLALCGVHRRNKLHNNARLEVLGISKQHPGTRDVVMEHNLVANSPQGVYMDDGCVGVLLRENSFKNVDRELMTPEILAAERAQRQAQYVDQQDPVAHYRFDRLLDPVLPNDAGKAFWGSPTGRLELESGVAGQAGRFDGDVRVVVNDEGVLQFPRLSLSAWIYPDEVAGRHCVIAKRVTGTAAPYCLSIRDGSVTFEGCDAENKWSYNLTSPAVVKSGTWSHIAAVCEDGVAVKLYYNGQQVAEKQVTTKLMPRQDPLTIGWDYWGGSNDNSKTGGFRGLIDEVQIWSRLLTAEEIAALHAAHRAAAEADAKARAEAAAARAALAQRLQTEIVAPGGVNWQPVVVEPFEGTALGPDWKTLRGRWTVKDGTLRCSDVSFLGYAWPVKAPVRIEFDGRSPHPSDLTAFWGTAAEAYSGGYFIGFASNNNSGNKILRLAEEVASNGQPNAVPNKWHHVIAQVIGNRVELLVEGRPVLHYVDPKPVTGASMPGLIAWGEGEFDNLRIYTGK